MKKISCSVGILSFNSESTIRRTLESVKEFAEVIICDGGSSDKTRDIAKEYGCKIISQDLKYLNPNGTIKNFAGVRNQCLDASMYDWFLYIDSDEMISTGLREEIRNIVDSSLTTYVYNVPIRILVDNNEIKYSSNYPGYQNRFFNKKCGARFIKEVHERINYNKGKFETVNMKNPWYVFFDNKKATNYLKHSRKYIKIEIERNRNQSFGSFLQYGVYGNLKNILKIFLKSSKNYLLHGFKDSMPIGVEAGRIFYIALLIKGLLVNQIHKLTK